MAFGGDEMCLLSSKLRPAASGSYSAASLHHCSRPDSRSTPELLLQSWKLRYVVPLGLFLSSHRILESSTRKSADSCILPSSLPVSVLNALTLDQRSPLPSSTKFSNSGPSSFRTDLASDASAPPTVYVTSHRFDCAEDSFLDGSFGVLRGPLDALPTLVAIAPVILV